MNRQHAWPEGHWDWPIKVTHKHGVRCGEFMFVGGQVALDDKGNVLMPDDLRGQTRLVMDYLERVLTELGGDIDDVVKLDVYYVNRGDEDERALGEAILTRCNAEVPPTAMMVPLPNLAYPGLMVEIEAIAMRGVDGGRLPRKAYAPDPHWGWPFSHSLHCGDLIFIGLQMPLDQDGQVLAAGDTAEQARLNIENFRTILAGYGAALDDIARINTFYLGQGTAEDWAVAGTIRGNAFKWPGPVATGVPVPRQFPDGNTLRQHGFAAWNRDGTRPPRRALRPPDHWDWPNPVNFQQGVKVGPVIFVGGQVSADKDSNVIHPHDMAAQAREAMDCIRRTLVEYGATMDDVVKVNCFYRGGADAEQLHKNFAVRSSCFIEPGPVTTGIPLESLGLSASGMEIEIEAVAMKE